MDAELQISTLGGLNMRLNGAPLTGFHSRKVDALVVFLCSTRQPQTRELLADLLWDEQRQNAGNLRVLLTDLRQVLAPFFIITRTTVAVNPDSPYRMDTHAFETGVDALKQSNYKLTPALAGALEKALAQYRGDFLQGFYIRESPRFEEWVLVEQERLRHLAVIALHALTGFYLERGEYARGIQHAERLFQIDPLNEANHLQLMQLLARNGEAHTALARYDEYKRLLATELNAEPSAEATALRDQIRAGTFSIKITVSARSNLPRALTPFVGREQELAALDARLRDPEVALVTLVGPGGVGKTRLALRAAEQAAVHFRDGVVFVALASVSDPELVPGTIAAALEVTEKTGETVPAAVKNYLHDKELLLLTDNFEQVVAAAPRLTDLLEACPRVKILATSRTPLHVYGEHEFLVAPLGFPDLSRVSASAAELVTTMAHFPAVALFVQRARAAQSDFRLSSENARAVADICARLDGLPLAIELAAARIKHLDPQTLRERLARRLEVLTEGGRDRAPRQQTLRGMLDWSYALLDEREKKGFRTLAVFVGGWTLYSAGQVMGEETPGVLNLLSSLADKSLIQRVVGDGDEPRFIMLETVGEYALAKLTEHGETEGVRRRHARYLLEFARYAETWFKGPLQVQWFNHVERELDNVRAAVQWAVDHAEGELGIELVHNLGRFWTVHDHWMEGRLWLERLLALPEASAPLQTRARGMYTLGLLIFWLSDFEPARTYLDRALVLAEAVPDPFLEGQILVALGSVHQSLGDLRTAQAMAEAGLTRMQEFGTEYDVVWGQLTLSSVLLQQGKFAEAIPGLEGALAKFREVGDHWARAVASAYLALIARFLGDTARSSTLKAEVLSLFEQTGDHARIGTVHFFLGAPSNEPAEHDAELAYFQTRVNALPAGENKRRLAEMRLGLAGALHRRGQEREAREHYLACLELLGQEDEHQVIAAECLDGLAGIAANLGQPERAARLFGAVDAAKRFVSRPIAEAWRGNYGADVARVRARLDEAAFNQCWMEGRALSLAQATAYALAPEEPAQVHPG